MSMFELFFKKKPKVVGLTLSGGGLRGIGHIGAIKALEEHGMKPDIISGASAGAIIGAFYAAGYSPDEMLSIALRSTFFSPSSLRFRVGGIFNPDFLERLIKEHILDNSFEALKIPLYVAVTDIVKGRTEYISQGELSKMLIASASIPFVFPYVNDGGKMFMDGGIMNNFPIEPIKKKCTRLIGVHVNAISDEKAGPWGAAKILDRIIHLALSNTVYPKAKYCNVFIDPPNMTTFSLFEKKDVQKIYDYVYDYTSNYLAKTLK
ncbi:patatin-like phospholipase family protein [Olivibacter sitiensis]|uniref:patatin-like phospholipase family protein n=1 Tax=Olivibacter sitiensis TaxID=376470 RepID=UPI0004857F77|nr:patatin-like phospholipase family protein [Olivibacter sitiensis]